MNSIPVNDMADSTLPDKLLQTALGRILIVLLQTVLISQVLLFSFFLQGVIDLILLKYIIVLLIGLLAGFSARRFLNGHTRTLAFLTALISAALSLGILHGLSGGFVGIDLFSGLFTASDGSGLGQFGLSALGAFLVINAFRPKKEIAEVSAPPVPVLKPAPSSSTGIKSWLPKLNPTQSKKSAPRISGAKPSTKATAAKTNSGALKVAAQKTRKAAAPAKLSVAPAPTVKKGKAAKPKKKKVKKEIKLVGDMEHICPYCLDPVQDHDPRGVKTCSQCKTRHHADCWGITGACQIPHSHK